MGVISRMIHAPSENLVTAKMSITMPVATDPTPLTIILKTQCES